jgi:hypothetical protein
LAVVNETAFGSRIVVSDPAAIRHMLVGNETNYVRDDLQRRIMLRTAGHSLSTSPTWPAGSCWSRSHASSFR